MGIGVLCRNYCRTSNQRIAYYRTQGKPPGVEAGLGVVGPALRPPGPPVRVNSALLLESAGVHAFLPWKIAPRLK